MARSTNSLDGGTRLRVWRRNHRGRHDQGGRWFSNPDPFGGGDFTLTVDNLGKQVDDYLGANTPGMPTALYIVWGGGNDFFDDHSDDNVFSPSRPTSPASCNSSPEAGARYIMVPNVPPLGLIPHYRATPRNGRGLEYPPPNYRAQLNTPISTPSSRRWPTKESRSRSIGSMFTGSSLPSRGEPGGLRLYQRH